VGADPLDRDFPGHIDGVRGMHFIDCVLRSDARERWTDVGTWP